jgi:phage head maturation protease
VNGINASFMEASFRKKSFKKTDESIKKVRALIHKDPHFSHHYKTSLAPARR